VFPTIITVYSDRTFTFELRPPPAAILLRKAVGAARGSNEPNKIKIGTVSWDKVEEIAHVKMPDLNTNRVASAKRTIAGTARSMGINVN
jgi:large subunit ribosomal protein L11